MNYCDIFILWIFVQWILISGTLLGQPNQPAEKDMGVQYRVRNEPHIEHQRKNILPPSTDDVADTVLLQLTKILL